LDLKYKFPLGGRSSAQGGGVALRVLDTLGKSPEVQIGRGTTGDFWTLDSKLQTSSAFVNKRFPKNRLRFGDKERRVGEWNKLEITCKSDKVTVRLNEELVNQGSGLHDVPGRICLLSQGTEIHFCEIVLTPLK
jgi:hypothetical protein